VSTPPISRLGISMTQAREMTLRGWSEPSALPGGMDREGEPDGMVPGLPACNTLHTLAADVSLPTNVYYKY